MHVWLRVVNLNLSVWADVAVFRCAVIGVMTRVRNENTNHKLVGLRFYYMMKYLNLMIFCTLRVFNFQLYIPWLRGMRGEQSLKKKTVYKSGAWKISIKQFSRLLDHHPTTTILPHMFIFKTSTSLVFFLPNALSLPRSIHLLCTPWSAGTAARAHRPTLPSISTSFTVIACRRCIHPSKRPKPIDLLPRIFLGRAASYSLSWIRSWLGLEQSRNVLTHEQNSGIWRLANPKKLAGTKDWHERSNHCFFMQYARFV